MKHSHRRDALRSWRTEAWMELWIYLTANGNGPLLCRDVAKAIHLDPRGLINLARQQPEKFLIEYRTVSERPRERPAVYVRINPKAISQPAALEHQVLRRTVGGTAIGHDSNRVAVAASP